MLSSVVAGEGVRVGFIANVPVEAPVDVRRPAGWLHRLPIGIGNRTADKDATEQTKRCRLTVMMIMVVVRFDQGKCLSKSSPVHKVSPCNLSPNNLA